MNVASLENCKTLFELSGWDFKAAKRYVVGGDGQGDTISVPAYDLGYLLQKMRTDAIGVITIDVGPLNVNASVSVYDIDETKSYISVDDQLTPENALCLLAIELFKQGILQ